MKETEMRFLPLVLLVLAPHLLSVSAKDSPASMALPYCPERCGDIIVPYPFGVLDGCSRDRGFLLTCNDTSFSPSRLFLQTPDLQQYHITNLTFDDLTISYTNFVTECFTNQPGQTRTVSSTIDLGDLPLSLSADRNKITVVGCDSLGVFSFSDNAYTGCFSFCSNTSVINNGTCSGEGCCQAPLRKGAKKLSSQLTTGSNHTTTRNISNCSTAFPVQQDWYVFNYVDVRNFTWKEVPVVLEWAAGSGSCEAARRSGGSVCVGGEGKTLCVDSAGGDGYRCYCRQGYKGNPYLQDGCEDINECDDPSTNDCSHICTNTEGNYTCSCPKGMYGEGRKPSNICSKNNPKFPLSAQITLGVGLGIMTVLGSGSCLYWVRRKRKYILLKESYFEKNGGMILRQQMSKRDQDPDAARIFSEEELKAATAGYSESRVLGVGGNGTVYRGILPDNRVVAIKKSKVVEQTQMYQFVNEIIILGKVIHRNVVRIVGYCLETQVPLLVYEYIPNGTLFEHIHRREGRPPTVELSWGRRLRIAAETAGAIAYLHSDLQTPIIHRDIKSANILLDDNFTAKVADFGASRLAPLDEDDVATMVQGTLGYLDPEYFQTGNLTEKSDVYSFGVVLAELLTGEKSISFSREADLRNLANYFLVAMKEDRLVGILDRKVMMDGPTEQVVAVAAIAKRCLRMKGEERPGMKEVAAELEKLRGFAAHGKARRAVEPLEVDGFSGSGRAAKVVRWSGPFTGDSSSTHIMDTIGNMDLYPVDLQR